MIFLNFYFIKLKIEKGVNLAQDLCGADVAMQPCGSTSRAGTDQRLRLRAT